MKSGNRRAIGFRRAGQKRRKDFRASPLPGPDAGLNTTAYFTPPQPPIATHHVVEAEGGCRDGRGPHRQLRGRA